MSKVGILSMQRIKNYGSFLQAYGLKKIIENMGHKVEFVDYHVEKSVISDKNKGKNDKLSKAIGALEGNAPMFQKIQYIIHKKNFGKKYYKILGVSNEPNYLPKLDTLVIGSDEVFNCIQSNKNVGYSMELFGKNSNAKRVITYAASFGNTTIEKIEKYNKSSEISGLLNNMDSISVRDENSGKIVKKLTEKEADYNLDPVLIYDFMNDDKLIPDINVNEKYMIVYAYANRISDEEAKYIKKFAKNKKLKVYAIGGPQKCADKFIDCSPFEVLSYFKNAEIIITDTFHGTIFSIINHKPFTTLVRKSNGNTYGNEEKLTDLLKRLKLENQIVYNVEKIEKILQNEIDYSQTDKIINNERKKSREYLKSNII